MSVVERLVQEAREKQRRAERKEAARKAVLALAADDRRELVAEMILLIEEEERRAGVPAATALTTNGASGNGANGHAVVTPFEKPQSFTDKAEAFVLARPQGAKTREVADGIGQDVSSVDGSLRLAMKRGRIARVGKLWVPVSSLKKTNGASAPQQTRTTIRDLINQVFASNGNTPIGAAALYEALRALKPDINRSSVDGEMNRMRKDNLLVQVGVGPNAGGLYKLNKEASTRPN